MDDIKGRVNPEDVYLPIHTGGHSPSKGHRTRTRLYALLTLCVLGFVGRHIFISTTHPEGSNERTLTSSVRNPAYLVKASHGAVASENRRCSDIGVQLLKDGGNAVDAAIGASLCTGTVNMFSSGIGGGGLMTVRIPPSSPNGSSEVYTVDFRETAPALANTTMYHNNPLLAIFGGLAVGVPGELRGFEEAHNRWGKLRWSEVVRPVAELAREWRVDPELARRIKMFRHLMLSSPSWRAIFAPEGRILVEGDVIRRTNYSRTLGTIASEGAQAFYEGPIADSIVRTVQSTGGILTHADLTNYTVQVYPSLQGSYRGKKVYTTDAPTSGPVLLHMMNLMERYDLKEEGRTGLNAHRLVEVLKFGFAARTRISDPSFGQNSSARISKISTKWYADEIAGNITDDRTHPPEYYNPEFDVKVDHGTSHTSAVDVEGMAVSLTSTVNMVFGSWVMDDETGVILNDEMDDFSIPGVTNGFGLRPSPYNYPEPHKRPLSSMVPTIMENADGTLYLTVGASGGGRIFGSVFQTILNVLEWGMDASAAIECGRVHDQLYPLNVDVDSVYPGLEGLVWALEGRGHNVTVKDIGRVAAVVQGIVVEDGVKYAASDSRKNGIAAGY